ASDESQIQAWDLATHALLWTVPEKPERTIFRRFTSDGKLVMCSPKKAGKIEIAELRTREVVRTAKLPGEWASAVRMIGDVLVGADHTELFRIDCRTGELLGQCDAATGGRIESHAITSDGRLVVCATSDGVKVCAVEDGEVLASFATHARPAR